MVAPLKFGSQAQTVISTADAAVTPSMLTPASAATSVRFQPVEMRVILSSLWRVYPHSPWEERSRIQTAAQDFSKYLPRHSTARQAGAGAPDQTRSEGDLLGQFPAADALQHQLNGGLADLL